MQDQERRERLVETSWKPEIGYFDEPSAGREATYRPWEATPVDLMDFDILAHQQEVGSLNLSMLDGGSYPYLTPRRKDFVDLIYFSREANRNTKNAQSYGSGLYARSPRLGPLTPEQFSLMNQRTLAGVAKPGEIHQVRKARGNGAGELTKLSHHFGYRLEYIDAMREEVITDLAALGAEIHEDPEHEYEIIAADNGITQSMYLEFGLAMTRKRHIATIDNAKVVERSSFIVLLDGRTQLDPTLIAQLKSVKIDGTPKTKSGKQSPWVKLLMASGELEEYVRMHLEENDFETIIPMSTTIFEYDRDLQEQIEAKRKQEQPDTSDIVRSAREEHIRALGGMAFTNGSDLSLKRYDRD